MRPSTYAELTGELNAIAARASQVWASAGDPLRSPRGGGWSVAQCLSHLALSTQAYLPVWRDALTAPGAPRTPRGTEPHRPLRLDTWGRLLYWFLQPPPKIRFNTRNGFHAPASSPAALEEFLSSQREFSRIVAQSEHIATDRIRIRSAYDPRVRYSIWSSFVTTVAHQRRHLWQAERAASYQ